MTNENLASVAELRIHPVKGLRGGVHMTADIEPWVWRETGAGWWWMRRPLPDPTRTPHHGADRGAHHGDRHLPDHSGHGAHQHPLPCPDAETLNVVVWRDTVGAVAAGTAADAWISAALGLSCRLVYWRTRPAGKSILLRTSWAAGEFRRRIPGSARLPDVARGPQHRLAVPIPIGRFRPNIVVRGALPWAEDCWRESESAMCFSALSSLATAASSPPLIRKPASVQTKPNRFARSERFAETGAVV